MSKLLAWLRCLTALATVMLAAALCWQCIDIFLTGNRPENLDESGVHIAQVYTAQEVGSRLGALAWPAAGYVLLIGVTAAVSTRVPSKQTHAALTAESRLRLMKRNIEVLPAAAAREEKLRRNVRLGAGAVVLGCIGACAAYLLDGRNFESWELETVVGRMLAHLLPWLLLGFAAAYAAMSICDHSMARECGQLKGEPTGAAHPARERRMPVDILRIVLFGAAVLFIVLGVMNGGLYDVLVKAINICTECIGLG